MLAVLATGHMTECLFHGHDYEPRFDYYRLKRQIERVQRLMADGTWRTVAEIHAILQRDPENSIQAQLRNLRKEANGGYYVQSRVREGARVRALYEYRVSADPAPVADDDFMLVRMSFDFDSEQRAALAHHFGQDGTADANALRAWIRGIVVPAMNDLVQEYVEATTDDEDPTLNTGEEEQ